jgi:hypothetical protein
MSVVNIPRGYRQLFLKRCISIRRMGLEAANAFRPLCHCPGCHLIPLGGGGNHRCIDQRALLDNDGSGFELTRHLVEQQFVKAVPHQFEPERSISSDIWSREQ